MTKPVRPAAPPAVRFDDPTPGRPMTAIDTPETPETPETPQTPQTDPPATPITDEDRDIAGQALYTPTVKRMMILVEALIRGTDNGDFVLWAPAAVIDEMLGQLSLEKAHALHSIRLLMLVIEFMSQYSEFVATYAVQFSEAVSNGQTPPPFPQWTQEQTQAIYRKIFAGTAPPTRESV